MLKELDPLLHSQLRLAVMSILISVEEADFVFLKEQTGATSGNLSVQIEKLKEAEYINILKTFRGKMPRTICKITQKGILAFEEHVVVLQSYSSNNLFMQNKTIGIMGAMSEEIHGIANLLTDKEEFQLGMRTYTVGKLNGIKTVVVFSRWGKVAAAITASTLILKFNVSEIIFTGVSGAINHELNIGDIVIGKRLIHHDLDARPLMDEFEIPLLGIKYIDIKTKQLEIAEKAVKDFINSKKLFSVISEAELQEFGIVKPKLAIGDIASGDKFFACTQEKHKLLSKLPDILCVEMEGAAVAQVCYEYGIPVTILRTVSDVADEKSHIDFPAFTKKISNKYSVELVKNIFRQHSVNTFTL